VKTPHKLASRYAGQDLWLDLRAVRHADLPSWIRTTPYRVLRVRPGRHGMDFDLDESQIPATLLAKLKAAQPQKDQQLPPGFNLKRLPRGAAVIPTKLLHERKIEEVA
jgi:hypothetical protein